MLLGAEGTQKEPAQGPLEIPHEEWVDDGVHGAVTVSQPCEDIEEAWGDAVARSLEEWSGSHLVPGQAGTHATPPRTSGTDMHKHTMTGSPTSSLPVSGLGWGSGPPQQGLDSPVPCSGITWAMLATKKGSQVTKNMPSRMPSVRLAFKAFLLCLVARRLLSADSTPGHGVLGICRKKGHVSQLKKSSSLTLQTEPQF